MNDTSFLKDNDIHTAIVVDDAYDPVPRASDLITVEDEWFNFFADLTDEDRASILEFYPQFENVSEGELRSSDSFVAELWDRRGNLRKALVDPLFELYDRDSRQDLDFIGSVEQSLETYDLEVSSAGRDFVEAARLVDLIVIDLFLGATQGDADMEISMEGLKKIINGRYTKPPIIVLMSRSSRLANNAEQFRDHVRVFASGFRTIKKSDLSKPGRLEQVLWELARYRQDSLKLTDFSEAWRKGLSQAVERTTADIRRLDLEDWAQIQDLLLTDEEVSTGNYILDVFDRVLLHEVERNLEMIDTAVSLDTLQSENYPPLTITGSKDTLGLVFKTLYQHENRRKLDVANASPVAFGDILCLVDEATRPKNSIFEGVEDTVFVVMTPACDLQRQEAPRALLMAGTFKSLDAKTVNPVSGAPRTVVLELDSNRRVCVDWQPQNIVTLNYSELKTLLGESGSVRVIARLRKENALSLQQRLLSHLGRVGLVSPIPPTFPVEVRVFYPDTNKSLVHLHIGNEDRMMGVCFVGRSSDNKVVRAPLDSNARFSFLDSLNALENDSIHANSLDKVLKAKTIEVINLLFSKGMRLDVSKRGPQDWKVQMGGTEQTLGKIIYNGTVLEALEKDGNRQRYGLIFEIQETTYGD